MCAACAQLVRLRGDQYRISGGGEEGRSAPLLSTHHRSIGSHSPNRFDSGGEAVPSYFPIGQYAPRKFAGAAPRSIKTGTTRSPFPIDAAARHPFQPAKLRHPSSLHCLAGAPSCLASFEVAAIVGRCLPGHPMKGSAERARAWNPTSSAISVTDVRGLASKALARSIRRLVQ